MEAEMDDCLQETPRDYTSHHVMLMLPCQPAVDAKPCLTQQNAAQWNFAGKTQEIVKHILRTMRQRGVWRSPSE
jgi:hypothetical protein